MYSVTYFFPCRSLRQRANRMMDLVIYYMDIDLQSKLELAGGRYGLSACSLVGFRVNKSDWFWSVVREKYCTMTDKP